MGKTKAMPLSDEAKIGIGAALAIGIGAASFLFLSSKARYASCPTGTYYAVCSSTVTAPTAGLKGVTVTAVVLSAGFYIVSFSDGTSGGYALDSIASVLKVGDCVYADPSC